MKIQQLSIEEALASVQASRCGLSAEEAARRLAEFGRNEVARVKREPLVLSILKEFGHFFAIILWVAAALAFAAERWDPGEGMRTLGFAIVGVVIVNGVFSFWRRRTRQSRHSRHCRSCCPRQRRRCAKAPEILFARVAADQKMRIVCALKRKREIVAVTGDGVNDAPALKHADIGIAMGKSGSDVAREAADMILLDDNFATIVSAVEEGRAVYANIRKFLTYILTSNVPELVPYLAFVLFRIPLPLTIIQILAVDLGTDLVPALALGAEKPDPLTMKQRPRARTDRLLSAGVFARAYGWLGPMQAAAALAAFFFVLGRSGWRFGHALPSTDPLYLQATTACLSAIIVMQIANVFICRSPRESAISRGLFGNGFILAGIAAELILIVLIDYTPLGNAIFGTAPIPLAVWLFTIPFAFGMLTLEELRKWIARRWNSKGAQCSGAGVLVRRESQVGAR